jgi:Na+-driven multidrug efflux pump
MNIKAEHSRNGFSSRWLKPPSQLGKYYLLVLPIILSQLLQRLYPIVDNHYLVVIGSQALLIHNIQYNLTLLGQFIGSATAMSCLIFWERKEYSGAQRNIFIMHLLFVSLISLFCGIILALFSQHIIKHFSVDPSYYHVANVYLYIGIINMVCIAIYSALDGILVAIKKQKLSVYFSLALLLGNIFFDYYAVKIIFSGIISPENIYFPFLLIGLSTTILLLVGIMIMVLIILKNSDQENKGNPYEMLKVWMSELGVASISGIAPIIYIFQIGILKSTQNFIVTYQMTVQIAYLFCLPLLAGMRIALRDAALNHLTTGVPEWWRVLLYTGLIPTIGLLIIGIVLPAEFIQLFYHYEIPHEQIIFISLYFLATLVGQIGNTLSIPIRAAKRSHLITWNFLFSEIVIMLGATQLLLMLNKATPFTLGFTVLLFTLSYCLLNLIGSIIVLKRSYE